MKQMFNWLDNERRKRRETVDDTRFRRLGNHDDSRIVRYYDGLLPGIERTCRHTFRVLELVGTGEKIPTGDPTHEIACWYRLHDSGQVWLLFGVRQDCRIEGKDSRLVAAQLGDALGSLLLAIGEIKGVVPDSYMPLFHSFRVSYVPPPSVVVLLRSTGSSIFWANAIASWMQWRRKHP